jgi:hypothetical protein
MVQFHSAVVALAGRWIVTVDDSPLNRDLWQDHDIHFITSRNGCGNQAIDPHRTFGEMIVYSPGLRFPASAAQAKEA